MDAAKKLLAALALGAVPGLALAASALAADLDRADAEAGYAPGQVLVRYEPGTSARERSATRERADAELERRLAVPRLELLSLERGQSVGGAVSELADDPVVAFAEPDFVYRLAALPDDPQFGSQWALDNDGSFGTEDADIDAPEAWSTATGDSATVVAVVDSGINLGHADLVPNLWANPGESGGGLETNLADDDGNAKVDDHLGWDFVDEDNDPADGEGHGTHVAGIIGAKGNNADGIAGVNWDVSLMPLRACNALGLCLSSDIADAYAYADQMGADVVNASLSGSGASAAQQAAIAAADQTLFVVAAGNDATNNDLVPRYPCNYPGQNLICVAATTSGDGLASYSNYGSGSVDLAAPGGSTGSPVLSTYLAEPVSQTFGEALDADWATGGTPDTWARTDESSQLSGGTLTDSPGGDYAPDSDNFARYGPVDLSAQSGCQLRYDLDLDVPEADDSLQVQASTDDSAYTTIHDWWGVGKTTLTPSLAAFSGSPTVYIRFRLQSDSDATVGDGAHVDNVRIRCPSTAYRSLQGTSMATPHVAGAAALLLDVAPGASVADLREWLLDGADLKPSLESRVAAAGRLNLARSVAGAGGADIHRPQTTITAGPPATSTATSASFSFSSDEPGSFACSLNGEPYAPCASPRSLSGLPVGQHTFRVRAVDLAGNEDATPAAYSFGVEASDDAASCAALRQKLKRAKSARKKRKLRKRIRLRCTRLGL